MTSRAILQPRERQAMRDALRAATATEAMCAKIASELSVGVATLRQVVDALATDWRDPREELDGVRLLAALQPTQPRLSRVQRA